MTAGRGPNVVRDYACTAQDDRGHRQLAGPLANRLKFGLLARRLGAEFAGTALLLIAVVGSGIAAQRLSPNDSGLELLVPNRLWRRLGNRETEMLRDWQRGAASMSITNGRAQLSDSNFSTDSQHRPRQCSCTRATLVVRTGNGH